jgi:hypothetical protein
MGLPDLTQGASNCPTWIHAHKDTHCSNKTNSKTAIEKLRKTLNFVTYLWFLFWHLWKYLMATHKVTGIWKLKPTVCIMDYLDLLQKIKCKLHTVHFSFLLFKCVYWHICTQERQFYFTTGILISTVEMRWRSLWPREWKKCSPKYCYLSSQEHGYHIPEVQNLKLQYN